MNVFKNKVKTITGIVVIILNLLWNGYWINLFYGYHFTDISWFYVIEDWILIMNLIIGLIGCIIGYQLIRGQWSIMKGLVIDLLIFAMGWILSHY